MSGFSNLGACQTAEAADRCPGPAGAHPGPILGCRFFSSVCCCPRGRLLLGPHECPHCLLQLALVAQTADLRAP